MHATKRADEERGKKGEAERKQKKGKREARRETHTHAVSNLTLSLCTLAHTVHSRSQTTYSGAQ